MKIFIASVAFVLTASCRNENAVPKPYGYFRIAMPENTYQKFDTQPEPYAFEYSTIAKIEERADKPGEKWLNIVYPQHNAQYISHIIT